MSILARLTWSTHVLTKTKVSKWERSYPLNDKGEDTGTRFCNVLAEAHRLTGRRAMALIDEVWQVRA